jgi:hypothetical protein
MGDPGRICLAGWHTKQQQEHKKESNERVLEQKPMTRRALSTLLLVVLILSALLLVSASGVHAQSAPPILSGGVGFIGTTNGGSTFLQPVIAPVVAVPLGQRWLLETRFDLRGLIFRPTRTADYQGQFFDTIEYAQVDYNIASELTIVAGRFLTPFNMYNERFTPIWIRNLQDAPIIFPIGTRTNGYSDGLMTRGLLLSRKSFDLNYTAYFSALSTIDRLQSGRAAGARLGIFVPDSRLEVGVSYQKLLQDQRTDSVGTYLSWQPDTVALAVRGEYAHNLFGQGYWFEGTYRLSRLGGPASLLGRLQTVGRVQQYFHTAFDSIGALPSADTQRVDFGLNYYLPHEIRLNASYGRQFSPQGNRNVWNFAITYRFLLPLFPERKEKQ